MESYCCSRIPAFGMVPADAITDTSSAAVASGIPSNFNPLFYPHSFPYQFSDVSHFSESLPYSPSDVFVQGSSLEDSPLSSPSSELGKEDFESMFGTTGYKQSSSPLAKFQLRSFLQENNQFVSSYSSEHKEPPIPDGIKMPQRKGGIQLWQFLYALLTDPGHMHPELIEWTCNRTENEFRLLEPEAIAVWWGYHKNKVNMNYEKFSRSLRYYYDKGILRKIPGERYIYRFCIDPERMYKHIGISDSRPQIKPMPEDVKRAIPKFQGKKNLDLDSPNVALAPEQLISPSNSDSHTYLVGSNPPVSHNIRPGPIERSRSFNVVCPQSPVNSSEELPRMVSSASLPNMYSFEIFSAAQDMRDSPVGSPVNSGCDRFSTSISGDFVQSYKTDFIAHDFDTDQYTTIYQLPCQKPLMIHPRQLITVLLQMTVTSSQVNY